MWVNYDFSLYLYINSKGGGGGWGVGGLGGWDFAKGRRVPPLPPLKTCSMKRYHMPCTVHESVYHRGGGGGGGSVGQHWMFSSEEGHHPSCVPFGVYFSKHPLSQLGKGQEDDLLQPPN